MTLILAVSAFLLASFAAVAGGAVVFLILAKLSGYQLGIWSKETVCPYCGNPYKVSRFLGTRNSICAHCGIPNTQDPTLPR